MRFGRQEDAHECTRYFVDGLLKSCLQGIDKYGRGQSQGLVRIPRALTREKIVFLVRVWFRGSLRKSMDPRSLETTLVHQIFGGYLRSQVVCLRCQRPSNTYDEFLDMSVDIMHAGSVQRALADFVRPERLDGDNRYHCERCRVKVPALKRLTVHEAPNVLTVHLKRFDPMNFASGGKIGRRPRRPGLMVPVPR